MTTTGQALALLSGLGSATALAHLAAATPGLGSGLVVNDGVTVEVAGLDPYTVEVSTMEVTVEVPLSPVEVEVAEQPITVEVVTEPIEVEVA